MITALEFGSRHHSCSDAMIWRRSLGPSATQADAWLACERGDWLIWQLSHGLDAAQYDAIVPVLRRAVDRIVERAILVAHHSMVDNDVECPEWESWAYGWVTGEDRTADAARAAVGSVVGSAARAAAADAAWAAAWSAAWAADAVVGSAARAAAADAAWAAELYMQAEDIRAEIPAWIWEEVPR
jgi:hypothetical protein